MSGHEHHWSYNQLIQVKRNIRLKKGNKLKSVSCVILKNSLFPEYEFYFYKNTTEFDEIYFVVTENSSGCELASGFDLNLTLYEAEETLLRNKPQLQDRITQLTIKYGIANEVTL